MSSGRPVISVHVDIAEFAGIVLAMPENERAEWVTSLAIALSRRDPSKATNPDAGAYAETLLAEAMNFIETRSNQARRAANARHRRPQGDAPESSKDANACTRTASHENVMQNDATEQSRPEQSNNPPSPNGDVPPRRRNPDVAPIPDSLSQIPDFKTWWLKWLDHRKQSRHQVTLTEAQAQLTILEASKNPVEMLRYSVLGGCQRLNTPRSPAPPPPRPASAPNLPPDYIPLDEAAREAKAAAAEMPCVLRLISETPTEVVHADD